MVSWLKARSFDSVYRCLVKRQINRFDDFQIDGTTLFVHDELHLYHTTDPILSFLFGILDAPLHTA